MGILEILFVIFGALFLVGLIVSVTIWLLWLAFLGAAVVFIIRLIQKFKR